MTETRDWPTSRPSPIVAAFAALSRPAGTRIGLREGATAPVRPARDTTRDLRSGVSGSGFTVPTQGNAT